MSDCTVNITVVLSDNVVALGIVEKYISEAENPVQGVERLVNLLNSCASGCLPSKVHVFADAGDGTQAAGIVVLTQANATDGDTITIGAEVFTVATTPDADPSKGEFAPGASDTAIGDNFAAAVNAHPGLKGMLAAVNAAGTVTLTLTDKGLFGNLLLFSTSDATMAALTQPTSGAEGTQVAALRTYRRGL